MPLEVVHGCPGESHLLALIDRFDRQAVLLVATGFHLDKHHRPAVDGYQIQFAGALPQMPGDNLVPLALEKLFGSSLTEIAQGLGLPELSPPRRNGRRKMHRWKIYL